MFDKVLATYFPWFKEIFERMNKDSREVEWRNLCESDTPELQRLPDTMNTVCTPAQRFCVVRAVRSDRLIPSALTFIARVLGKKYIHLLCHDFVIIIVNDDCICVSLLCATLLRCCLRLKVEK